MNRSLVLVVLSLSLAVLACGLGGELTQGAPDEAISPDRVPDEPQVDVAVPTDLFFDLNGVEEIELLTPTEGVGLKPLFEWQAVEGVTNYLLILQDASGQTYWTWRGPSTSIYLGGVDAPPPENAAGPVLHPGMAWAVVALDAEDHVIASSVLQPISP